MKTRSRLLIVSLFVSLLVATPARTDASQVLALSVSFGTLKNSTKMTDAMREESRSWRLRHAGQSRATLCRRDALFTTTRWPRFAVRRGRRLGQ